MDREGQGSLYHFYYYYYYCVETGMALVYPSLLSERPRGTLSCYTLTTPHPLSTVSENELQRILQMSNAPYQQMGNAPLSDSQFRSLMVIKTTHDDTDLFSSSLIPSTPL